MRIHYSNRLEAYFVCDRIRLVALIVALLSASSANSAKADEHLSVLTLDSLSFVSFGDTETFSIPAGSTIQFRFSDAAPNGIVPFEIRPSDVSVGAISLGGNGATLDYSLGSVAHGSLYPDPSGHRLSFSANVVATLDDGDTGIPNFYSMPFSTESVHASDAAGSQSIEVSGLRIVDGVWYLQIVGAVSNKTNAYPAPGTWVYTVLSGTFDNLPL